MYSVVAFCLLSAAVALPTPEQLHTNVPAIPPPPELKPEEGDSVDPLVPNPEIAIEEPDKLDEIKNQLESAEKSKEENDKAQDKLDDKKVIQKDSKESKESKDSKEKSKESKESKELNDLTEIRPEEPQEEKKEKDSKSEELNERFDDGVPVIVEVIKGSKDLLLDWIKDFFQNIHFPEIQWPFGRSELRNGEQPIYIIKESDLDFD